MEVVDAVVVGAGPNGLVGACVLADAGWEVVVLEEQAKPGGAVRTEELTEPGFHSDVFSSFYPLAAASPHLRALAVIFQVLWIAANGAKRVHNIAAAQTSGTIHDCVRKQDRILAEFDVIAYHHIGSDTRSGR